MDNLTFLYQKSICNEIIVILNENINVLKVNVLFFFNTTILLYKNFIK